MNRKSLRDHLSSYYVDRVPTADFIDRLKSLAADRADSRDAAALYERVRRWRLVAAVSAACAAVFLGGWMLDRNRSDRPVDPSRSSTDRDIALATGNDLPPELSSPALVVLMFHADWCGRCPSLNPIFDQLTGKYGQRPTLFVRLNVTDAAAKQQSRVLATNLDLDWVFELQTLNPGKILLVDRAAKKVLSTMTDEQERDGLEGVLALALSHDSPG